ncbi:putative Mg2+ transporter-C (MgtC) family protein [Salsuginibacillus halophilus]|uniref:Putative Mg2+ transporter-C (MgtC) family protein n=1 Tax=Salsuginibacillus halophilus TaxID=517424 RepID=A0A2P8H4Z9_9BACI|nr:MgtC/SapB family protein [Salsuginibacillus halophilus]PSL41291.1 putative Mg2+ transporter-C (MgtC) family protein [Salsuginibacillus halophilus]
MDLFIQVQEIEVYVVMLLRLLIAAGLAGAIGIEREYKHHPAGFRTHMLVGVGACLVMLMAMFGFESYLDQRPDEVAYDPSRLAAYVISGVGFLGAGTIIVQGVSVRGLTTAASIWVVAGIGLATGAGMYFAAGFTTVIVLMSLFFLNRIDGLFKSRERLDEIQLRVDRFQHTLHYAIRELEDMGVSVTKVKSQAHPTESDRTAYQIEVRRSTEVEQGLIYERLQNIDGVEETIITKPGRLQV